MHEQTLHQSIQEVKVSPPSATKDQESYKWDGSVWAAKNSQWVLYMLQLQEVFGLSSF